MTVRGDAGKLVASISGDLDQFYLRLYINENIGLCSDTGSPYRLTVELAGFKPNSWGFTNFADCGNHLINQIIHNVTFWIGGDKGGVSFTEQQADEVLKRIANLAKEASALVGATK